MSEDITARGTRATRVSGVVRAKLMEQLRSPLGMARSSDRPSRSGGSTPIPAAARTVSPFAVASRGTGLHRPLDPDSAGGLPVIALASYESEMSGALVYPDVWWRHDAVGLRP